MSSAADHIPRERALTVALDCRELPLGPSGDRTYLLSLIREYGALAPHWRFLLSYQAGQATGLEGEPLPASFEVHHLRARPGWLWTPWAWPRMLRRQRADVAHAQHLVPPYSPCPTVVTIHDVSFLRHPEWFPPRQVRIMRWLIPLSARRATRVHTGSHHAATEIAELCRVPRERIVVIPDAAAEEFTPGDVEEARARVFAAYGLRDPYLLAVGLIQPRKNLPRLVEAFAQLAPRYPELTLAIAGRVGWREEELHRRLDASGLRQRVALVGAVGQQDLVALYRGARVMVYPSLYEGFGLPPLEAMACGTPVVASNTTSLPEVVGDAGLLVDPTSSEGIAAAIARVLDDPDLAADLSARGLQRAWLFSWRRSAQEHLALYTELAS